MKNNEYIGTLSLHRFPKLDLLNSFTEDCNQDHLQQFYLDLDIKLKKTYLQYIIHMLVVSILGLVFFYLGYNYYDSIFPLSVAFSVIFVGLFIYSSKAIEIKARYFKIFKPFFIKSFSSHCSTGSHFVFILKKKKFLIFIQQVI